MANSTSISTVGRHARARRSKRRDELLERLADGVERLLANGDRYADLPINLIVSEADVARSTFYVYFVDKSELLLALYTRVVAELVAEAQLWWNLPPHASRDELEEALAEIFKRFRKRRHLWGAAVEGAAYDADVRDGFETIMARTVDALADHIRQSQAQGFARPDRDPKRTAGWLLWMMERGLYQMVTNASARETKLLLKSLTDIYWDALYEGFR